MARSNKNFARHGFKTMVLNWEEKEVFERTIKVKKLCKISCSGYFFNDRDKSGNDFPSYGVLKNWGRHLKRVLGVNFHFNSNRYRKRMCSSWVHKVSDPSHVRAIDEHLGHSREVARSHYENYQKNLSGRLVSTLVSRTLDVSIFVFESWKQTKCVCWKFAVIIVFRMQMIIIEWLIQESSLWQYNPFCYFSNCIFCIHKHSM